VRDATGSYTGGLDVLSAFALMAAVVSALVRINPTTGNEAQPGEGTPFAAAPTRN